MSLTLYRNGSVYSAADPLATAMLVDGDTVAWVGGEHAATSLADGRMEVIDLQGMLITPGFVDSHVHVTETGLALSSLDLRDVPSLAAALELVAGAARDTGRGTGALIRGYGWDESGWPEGRGPSPAELDRAAGGREVYLARVDVHSAAVSAALAGRLGLAALDGWQPEGPVLRAAHLAARAAAGALTEAERGSYQQRALAEAASQGYVAVAEMAIPAPGAAEDLRLLMGTSGAAHARTQVLPYWAQAVSSEAEARSVLAELGVPVIGLAGDLNMDGSIGSRTAWLREPYADAPDSSGTAYLTAGQAGAHLAAATAAGLQGGFHVIGDAGLDAVIEGLRIAADTAGIAAVRSAGHRLEHAEMADAGAIAALAEYSVTVSMQPVFDALWGGAGSLYARRLGAGRGAGLNPIASYFGAGVPVCFGSDAPVTPMRPWSSVRAALEHHQSRQRISARAAFIGHTRAGWRAARERDPLMGQLVPGAPASFAVWEVEELMVQVADERVQSWSTDPRARTPLLPALDTDTDPRCVRTVHRGQLLYSA
ncbi:MAG: amidohydrolase [Actinomycetales bacterium]